MAKLNLSTVTLCAATSVNVSATLAALGACLDQVDFADCLLFTDARITSIPMGIRMVPIDALRSSSDYSEFMIKQLADHIHTPHCLIVQWDGFVLDASQWDPRFLDYDYIGAPWPQFTDHHNVGNGGFSLRSRALLQACKDHEFRAIHPEDVAICRDNRAMLESRYGIHFADEATAARFAFERSVTGAAAFGFHGVFNMMPALGAERFWQIYCTLDDPRSAFVDFRKLIGQLGRGRRALVRRAQLGRDRLADLFRR